MLDQLLGNLLFGIALGAVYGLATMGLSLIFGVLKIVNVGHGQFIMIGAYTAFWMFTLYKISPLGSILIAFAIGLAVGFTVFHTIIKKLAGAPELTTLLATFATGIFIEELAKFFWGPDYRGYSWDPGRVDLGFALIAHAKIYALVLSVIIAFSIYLWFQKTRLGTAVRAVVEDRQGAMVCGINVQKVYALSFALGIALTVTGGVLVTLFVPVGINPYMGHEYTLKAFVIAVLGGLFSPWGAFYAGFIFGLLENGSYTLLSLIPGIEPFSLTRTVTFLVLLLILLIKPAGLLGGKNE
ncbi:MAG: branched-chain amino acid ABC transporter permease [Peptococcaceae bacterium]|nr:MAG: branched-chain amino acid ABC transporter permease [Peptococcaceae bacterium]